MIILDTDLVSLLQRSSPERAKVLDRIAAIEHAETVATSIITYEEQTRGWFSLFGKAKSVSDELAAYDRLLLHVRFYRENEVVGFDEVAAVHLQRLRSLKLKIATMDLKVAAVALANNAMLWSRNLHDFARVPALRVEDPTR